MEVFDEASVVDGSQIQADNVEAMVGDALTALATGAGAPWQTILPDYASGMRIGIKVNCLNVQCPTSVPVVRALVGGLQAQLGIDASDIIVWDRRLDELERCGFTEASVGVPVLGTINAMDDPTGPGYENAYCNVVEGKTTRLSRILTEVTDLTINCPVLKTHGISGVTAAMKNMYGVIDNPADFHRDLNDALPAIYDLAPIRERMRLHVLDALLTVTVGGTSSPMDTVAHRVIVSEDPLALDSHALQLVNQLRSDKGLGLPEIDPAVLTWLDKAQELGLGSRAAELTSLVK